MDPVNSLINNISIEIYQELKAAVELGRWQSGNALSESQKSLSIQALIAYENKHLSEKDRTAYIHRPEHEACDSANNASLEENEERPILFK
jgi:uncharacterized protein YeaC (DUF1315 family)